MPLDHDSEGLDWVPRSAPTGERIARGWTRGMHVSWGVRLAAIVLPVAAVMVRPEASVSLSAAPDRVTRSVPDRQVEALAFSPDGRTLAAAGFDRAVHLWDRSRWSAGRLDGPEILAHPSDVRALAFSPDGAMLATAADQLLTIWSRDPSYRRQVERSGATYHGLAFSPDGRTLALGAQDGSIRLWAMPEARERAISRGHSGAVQSLAFSPDGKVLVSGSQEGRVMLWDPVTGAVRRVLMEKGSAPIRVVAFSPDGRTVGIAEPSSEPIAVFLCDAMTGEVRTHLFGHAQGINSLAYSPDGRILATAGLDRSLRLWHMKQAKEPTLLRDGAWLSTLAFSPDGRWLAYAGDNDTVQLVDMSEFSAGPAGAARDGESGAVKPQRALRRLPAPFNPA